MDLSLRKIAEYVRNSKTSSVVIALLFALPLLNIPNNETLSVQLQSLLLVTLGITIISYQPYRAHILKVVGKWSKLKRILLVIFLGLLVVSSTFSREINLLDSLLGIYPEYIGLLQWLSFIIIATFVSDKIKYSFNGFTIMTVITVVITASIIKDWSALLGGFRLNGLLMQSTNAGVYACLGVIICFVNLKQKFLRNPYFTSFALIICSIGIVLAQSRIAIFAFALIMAGELYIRADKLKATLVSVMSVVVILLAFIAPSYVSRYKDEQVSKGLQYRQHIYASGMKEIAGEHILIGNGAGAHPVYLNEQKEVPEDIAKDLNVGLRFASAHDIIIDIGLMFGLAAMIIAIFALAGSFLGYRIILRSNHYSLFFIFLVLLMNALVNVPSIYLTAMLLIFVFIGLTTSHEKIR